MTRKMISQYVVALTLLFSILPLYAANNPASPAQANSDNTFTEEKPNFALDRLHNEFIIKLNSNRTTGYSWFVREYDTSFVTAVKHSYVAPTAKLMGAPGYELWTFRLKPTAFVVPHLMLLRFVYARPWENAAASKQVIFQVSTLEK